MQSGVSILSTFVQFLCFTQFGGSSHRLSFDKFAAQLLKGVEFVYRILSWGLARFKTQISVLTWGSHATLLPTGALRDDTKNGCEGD